METVDYSDGVLDGKNKFIVQCKYCSSKILSPKAAPYLSSEFTLPLLSKKSEKPDEEVEILRDFWEVDDMYTFENVAFTHTVNNLKYLGCADCDRGPIGYHNVDTKKSFVALARVENKTGESIDILSMGERYSFTHK